MLATLALAAVFLLFWLLFALTGHLAERLLTRAAHWTAHFRYGDYLPVVVALVAGLAATLVIGDGFIDLAVSVRNESRVLREVDTGVHQWAASRYATGFTTLFVIATTIGTPLLLATIVAAVAAALVTRGHRWWAAYLVVTSIVGGLANLQLKAIFARSRPELADALVGATGYSFPSGHAMGSAVVFGALSYVAVRALKTWRHRAAAAAFCWTLVVAISASRVYLGVHWISDVAAGIAAGTVWVIAATIAYETFRRIRKVRALRRRRPPEAG